jgi:hypothetical protein
MKTIFIAIMVAFVMPVFAGYNVGKLNTVSKLWEVGSSTADVSTAIGTIKIFEIPANSAVCDVKAYVETGMLGASAATLGDVTDPDGFLTNGFATSTGLYPSNAQAATYGGAYSFVTEGSTKVKIAGCKAYATAKDLSLVLTGTATVGKIRFLIDFLQLK